MKKPKQVKVNGVVMAERRSGISNNGLAGWFSAEYLGAVVGFIFLAGVTYTTLGGGIQVNKRDIEDAKQAIKILESTQIEMRTDAAEIKSTQKYQLLQQQKMQDDINQIIRILTREPSARKQNLITPPILQKGTG